MQGRCGAYDCRNRRRRRRRREWELSATLQESSGPLSHTLADSSKPSATSPVAAASGDALRGDEAGNCSTLGMRRGGIDTHYAQTPRIGSISYAPPPYGWA